MIPKIPPKCKNKKKNGIIDNSIDAFMKAKICINIMANN